jgi:DNA-directed RNA polymerase alpha subunit
MEIRPEDTRMIGTPENETRTKVDVESDIAACMAQLDNLSMEYRHFALNKLGEYKPGEFFPYALIDKVCDLFFSLKSDDDDINSLGLPQNVVLPLRRNGINTVQALKVFADRNLLIEIRNIGTHKDQLIRDSLQKYIDKK